MKYVHFFLIAFLYSLVITAQTDEDDGYDYVDPNLDKSGRSEVSLPIRPKQKAVVPAFRPSYENAALANDQYDGEFNPGSRKETNRTQVGVELGSSASSDFKGNSAITTYAAPHIRHQLDDRISISAGLLMSKTFLNGWTGYSLEGNPVPSSIFTTAIYGRLDYRLSDRVSVYGAVYKSMLTMPDVANYNGSLDGTGFAAGLEYKMSDRSFLQIQVQRSSGYNPFSPYSNGCGIGSRPFSYFP